MQILLPLCCLPPVPFFAILFQKKNVFIEVHETFPKQTFRNRFTILNANGYETITIAVTKPSGNATKTRDVLISSHNNLQTFIRSFDTTYHNSPYYEFFRDQLVELFTTPPKKLIDFNAQAIQYVLKTLKIHKQISFTDTFIHPDSINLKHINDLRFIFTPKNPFFHTFASPVYYHTYHTDMTTMPALSIVDLLFHLGLETIDYLYEYPVDEFIAHIKHYTL